jgi:hypothetical protein
MDTRRLRLALRVVHEQYVRAQEEKKAFEAGLQQQGGGMAAAPVFLDLFQRLNRYSMYSEQVCVYVCVCVCVFILLAPVFMDHFQRCSAVTGRVNMTRTWCTVCLSACLSVCLSVS